MTKEELIPIAKLAVEKDIIVISDEIYSELTYGDEGHFSIAALPGMAERTIVVNGFSKASGFERRKIRGELGSPGSHTFALRFASC